MHHVVGLPLLFLSPCPLLPYHCFAALIRGEHHTCTALLGAHCNFSPPAPCVGYCRFEQIYSRYQQYLSKTIQTSVANSTKVAEEVVSSMATVRSFANEPMETKRWGVRHDA